MSEFSVYQTSYYMEGKVRKPIVSSASPVENAVSLKLPDNYLGGCTDNFGDVELILQPGYGQSGAWPPAVGDTFLAVFGGTEEWLATCINGGYTATFTVNDETIAEVNNGSFNVLLRPTDSTNANQGGTVIGIGPIKKAGTLTVTVTVDAPTAPGKGTMVASQTITIA